MTKNGKIGAAAALGALVLLAGPYILNAVEQNKAETASLAALSDNPTAAVTPNKTESKASPRTVAPIASTAPVPVANSSTMIAAGTTVKAKIETPISSRNAKVGDRVTATTTEAVIVNGTVVIPAGSTVVGSVTEVKSAAQTKAAAVLKVSFSRIGAASTTLALVSPDLAARARAANHTVDGGLVVAGAGAGAVIGNQTDNKHGTEIGAVVGGVIGGVAAANIGANVQLKAGETATIKFTQDVRL